MAKSKKLTAENLKDVLWETLQQVKNGSMEAGQGDAIASQAREILRTTIVQLKVAQQGNRAIPADVVDFSENSGKKTIAIKDK